MATTSLRLDKELVDKATIMAKALNRTPSKQIEHWAEIGEMMEDIPTYPTSLSGKPLSPKRGAKPEKRT